MSLILVTCTEDALQHFCDPCDAGEGDGVRSVFFYKEGAFADVATPSEAEFTAGQEASPATVVVIPEVRGTYDGGSPTYGEGFGDHDTSFESASHKLEYVDPNYVDNRDFYNGLQKQTQWLFGWRTETQLHFTNKKVTAYGKDTHTGDVKKKIRWNVEVTWVSKDKPSLATIPDGVFICQVND